MAKEIYAHRTDVAKRDIRGPDGPQAEAAGQDGTILAHQDDATGCDMVAAEGIHNPEARQCDRGGPGGQDPGSPPDRPADEESSLIMAVGNFDKARVAHLISGPMVETLSNVRTRIRLLDCSDIRLLLQHYGCSIEELDREMWMNPWKPQHKAPARKLTPQYKLFRRAQT